MTLAFIFPGQGSQAVGMGAELADAFASARAVFEEVDEALKQKLSKLMREGPEGDLTLTENAQPALMAVSLAVMRTLEAGVRRRGGSRRLRGGPQPGRIFRPVRGGRHHPGRHSAPVEAARPGPCSGPCRWARAPWPR